MQVLCVCKCYTISVMSCGGHLSASLSIAACEDQLFLLW